jgi:hypothetical protein
MALESWRYRNPAEVMERMEESQAFERMDHRLKKWGAWSRAGCIRPELWESDPPPSAEFLTRDDVEDAWGIQCMVMRLPQLHRLVLAVQYVHWREVEIEPWQEVNKRLARLARAAFEQVPLISRHEFRPIRDRAVRMLINSEDAMMSAIKAARS